MAPDERRDQDEDETLRVTDRRRFTEAGDARDGESEESSTPTEPAPEPPAVEPESGGTDAETPSEPGPTAELGIASVFYAFWQGALMNLGAAHPGETGLPVNLEAARESIELLRVLQQKTAGNLSEEEDGMLRHLLHQAQVAYVQVAEGGAGEGGGET